MRIPACVIAAAVGLVVQPAFAETDRSAARFWRAVQTRCDAAAAKPATELGRRIAQTAIDEFTHFGGHRIDSDGRLFRFGLTEAEHGEDEGSSGQPIVGQLGWWQVMKYWRALFADDPAGKLEVRGYNGASTTTQDTQVTEVIPTIAADLLREADKVSNPGDREALREAALRAAVIDTPWSAAFISYVVRQAGAPANSFLYANAHRAYIYDAFAATVAEPTNEAGERLYRACPIATRPRPGDVLCEQREAALADASDAAVRERIRAELADPSGVRSVRRTHCEVVAHVDARARAVYTVGGNVNQAVTARKLNLRGRSLRVAAAQKGRCAGRGHWTLPQSSAQAAGRQKCSLNDKKWFVLLQLR